MTAEPSSRYVAEPDERPLASAPHIRQLAIDDLTEMTRLQAETTAGLPAGFIRARSRAELLGYLDGALGVAYGVASGERLLAMSLLKLPSRAHPNPNGEPRFPIVPPKDWPLAACFMENTMVHPTARGRGYQSALLNMRFAHAKIAGMRWVCAGVRLENVASWRNLLEFGLSIVGIMFVPGYPVLGMLRSCGPDALLTDAEDERTVPALDARLHLEMHEAGYIGVCATRDGRVVYRALRSRKSQGEPQAVSR